MSDYPPEVQAVLVAAAAWAADVAITGDKGADLVDAVAAYRKSIAPPEPFETHLVIADGQNLVCSGTIHEVRLPVLQLLRDESLWRCTVTPVERVR